MKQLSSSELNNLSKQDLIAMMLQIQQQMNTLTEKMAIANARFLAALLRSSTHFLGR